MSVLFEGPPAEAPAPLYVYSVRWRYFGKPREMKPEEAEAANARLAAMMLEARWSSIEDLAKAYGQFVTEVEI